MTLPPAAEKVVPLLRCPHCAVTLHPTATGVSCGRGHTFDRARQGHLTLFGPRGRRFPGDTPDQVAARERFLGGGWYAPLADALAHAVATEVPDSSSSRPVVAEFGAGTGYYLAHVLGRLGAASTGRAVLGIGAEISVPAARRLARARRDLAALVCDTWEPLPVADGALDAVMVVFAPRNPAEFARVLRPGAVAVVVTPEEGHLEPLRSGLGMLGTERGKDARLAADFADWEAVAESVVDRTLVLPRPAARDLALMGPSGVHLEADALEVSLDRAYGTDDVLPTRLHARLRVYRRPG